MDKQLIRTRFAKSIRSYAEYAQAQTVIASRLCSLLSAVLLEEPRKVLEVGCGTGTFTRRFLEQFRPEEMVLNDICPEVEEALVDLLSPQVYFTPGDAETCTLPGDRDLIVSCSVLQWFEDPGAFIVRCRELVRGGGCIALTTFGPDNLQEVTAVTGTGLSYLPLEWLHGLLDEAGLRTVLAEDEHLTLHFPSPTEVLRHLKHTGVTGVREKLRHRIHRPYLELRGQAYHHPETHSDREHRHLGGHRAAPQDHEMRPAARGPRGTYHARDIFLPVLSPPGRRDRRTSDRFLDRKLLTIDYIAWKRYPLIYVTSGRLGSINHFLLGLEAIRARRIRLHTVAYNLFPREEDDRISRDTECYIRKLLAHDWPDTRFITVPELN